MKKPLSRPYLLTFLIILLTFSKLHSASYYWIGGSGNWSSISHWATTSGGSVLHSVVPGPNDDVFFNASSGFTASSKTIIVDVSAVCRNMTWLGALNTPMIFGGATNPLNIYGSLVLQNNMSFSVSETRFKSLFTGETLTTNGINIEGNFVFDGPGSWTLLDDVNNTGTVNYRTIFLVSGTLNTNGKRVTTGIWTTGNGAAASVNLPSTFTLNLGSSTIICTNTNYTWYYLGSGTTLNAGTSHIIVASSSAGGLQYLSTQPGHTYYNLTVNNPFSQTINCTINNTSFHRATFFESSGITGSARFDSLILTAGNTYKLAAASTHSITAALVSTVAACSGVVEINSTTSGTQATFAFQPGSAAAVSNTVLKDIRATGAIIPVSATSSFDMSNNTGFVFTPPVTKTLYWVGASGNWNDKQHWSTNNDGIFPASSGGCVPTPTDNVVFNNNSGFTISSRTVTLSDAYQNCQSMTWTGALNMPTLSGASTNALNIYGSMTLQNTMVYTVYETRFKSPTAGRTITTNGVNIDGNFYFDGFGGWTLLDNVNNTGVFSYRGFYLVMGTLNTNSQRVTTGMVNTGNNLGNTVVLPNTFSLILGSSVITCVNTNYPWNYQGTGTSINAGTSHVVVTSAVNGGIQYLFTHPGHIYYNLTINSPFNQTLNCTLNNTSFHRATFFESSNITGGSKFDSLIFTVGNTYKLQAGVTHTITSALVSTVTPCSGVIEINTATAGTQTTFSFQPGSAATISNTLLKDIRATGAIIPITTVNSFDLGNTTNFIFPVSAGNTLYWVGGTGNWTDKQHWSTNNDGIFPASSGGCVPTPADNVIFNNNSGFTTSSRIVTLNSPSQYCRNMTWIGALNTPTLTGSTTSVLNIYGSMVLQNNMAYTVFETRFKAVASAETISTTGINIDGNFHFEGTGNWILLDNLNNTGNVNYRGLYFLSGTLNTNGKQVTTGMWTTGLYVGSAIALPNTFTVNLGSSTIICTHPSYPWNYQGTGASLNAGTSHIIISSPSNSGMQYFYSQPNHVYYNLTVNSNTQGFNATFTGLTFHRANISAITNTTGSAKFDTLVFNAGYVYSMQAATTFTVNNAFYTSGNPCFVVFIKSLTSGTRANINVLAGNTSYDFVDAKDINASGLAFSAAGHSTNSGNNLNISFAPTTTLGIVGLGPDQLVPCNAFPFTLNTTNFYPNPNTTFTWYNASTTNTIAVADSGRYFISVNYGTSCIVKDTIRLSKPAAIPVTASASTNTICNGASVNLSASGVTSYLWSTGATNPSISVSPSTSTVYSVTGTDVNNCTNTKTLSITVNPTPVVAISSVSSNSICPGNNTIITPSGLSSYTLQPGNITGSSFNVSPSSTTTYTINGTSAAGCISTAASEAHVTITVNSIPTIGITSVSNATICSGNNSVITPNGAASYTLIPGNLVGTSFNVSPTTTTTYTINGTNAAGCISTAASAAQPIITVNPTPVIGITSVSNASICPGNNTIITPNGASTYTLQPGNLVGTSFNVSPATTTSYTINGTSALGCTNNAVSAAHTTITVNPTPVISITSVSNATICSGNNSIITPGGAGSYTLQPGNVVGTSFNVSPATTTSYTINGTSTAGCINTAASAAQTTITVNPTPAIGITSVSNASVCPGNNTIITPNGSATYTLQPGNLVGTSFNVNPSVTTTYTINGTSALGCINTAASAAHATITVNPTPVIGIVSVSNATICSGNNSTITPGGAGSYTLQPGNVVGTSFNVSPSVTTTYTINGTSALGCISTAASEAHSTITVNATPTIGISFISSNTICPGNSSVITPGGSLTYTLQPGNLTGTSFTVSPLSTTGYTISGTSAAGCNSTPASIYTTTVAVSLNPSIGISSISSNSICPGNSSVITPNGSATYTLMPGNLSGTSFTVSPATTTSYTISGTSAAGCISPTATPVSTTITVNSTPAIGISSVSNSVICSGDNAIITPNGAASYTLQPGNLAGSSFTVSPTANTTYTINGTSAAGCISTASSEVYSTILINATPTVNIASVSNNTLCSGNSSIITPSGSATYTLMPGNLSGSSFTVSPSVSTTYTINGTSAQGCLNTPASAALLTLTVNPTPALTVTQAQNVLCFGQANGSLTLTPSGGTAPYSVAPATTTGLTAGNYTYTVTDAIGCLSNTIVTVTQPSAALASTENTVSANSDCIVHNGSASVAITGGTPTYSVNWSSGATGTIASDLTTGINSYTVTDANGCSFTNTLTLPGVTGITASAINQVSVACFAQASGALTFTTSGTGPFTYTLSSATNTFTNTSGNFANLAAGSYTLNVTGSGGCTDAGLFSVVQPASALSTVTVTANPIACFGSIALVSASLSGGTAPYTYNWQGNASTTFTASYAAGSYSMEVTDANNCVSASSAFNVSQPTASLTVTELSVNPACVNQNDGSVSISVIGGTPSYSVTWSNGSSGLTVSNVSAGNLSAVITDANGCISNYATSVPDKSCTDISIPQFFTPNGDGKNDMFTINGIENYPNNSISIFNRWGSLIYSKKQYTNNWNGKANVSDSSGEGMLPSGTYFLIFDFGDGKTKPYNGYIELKY